MKPLAAQAERATSAGTGSPPAGGFAAMVPELDVTDIQASLDFWCGPLGFSVAFDRPAAGFAYLERGPIQVMLCQWNGSWDTAELVRPHGRGINFQMTVESLEPILDGLKALGWPLFRDPAETWYRTGDVETGVRECLVQDPDGYLLRFSTSLGQRAPARA